MRFTGREYKGAMAMLAVIAVIVAGLLLRGRNSVEFATPTTPPPAADTPIDTIVTIDTIENIHNSVNSPGSAATTGPPSKASASDRRKPRHSPSPATAPSPHDRKVETLQP